jgi:hypothetical protein
LANWALSPLSMAADVSRSARWQQPKLASMTQNGYIGLARLAICGGILPILQNAEPTSCPVKTCCVEATVGPSVGLTAS